MLVTVLIGLAVALVAAWLAFAVLILVARPKGTPLRVMVGLVPDTLRLVRRLAADPSVPRGVRLRLGIALAYNLQPFNLIPDFVPVIGFADNVVVIMWALRSAIRAAGTECVLEHWPGSVDELELLFRVARLGPLPETPAESRGA